MALGVAATAWLLPGPRRVGEVTFDVQTLLFACMAVVIGFQAVVFSVLGTVFAWHEGLLPVGERFRRAVGRVTLEAGLAVGLLLVLAGGAGAVTAVARWSSASFGALDASRALRVTIPSLTALVLGAQIVLASFFLTLLDAGRHRPAGRGADGTRATHSND
jgi:hypothetical protein